jgi:ABC-type nitrate/sulfonate/bicarbonate transport system permease component
MAAPPLLLAIALIGGWQLYASLAHPDPALLPSPLRVAEQGWQNRPDLWSNTLPTVRETLAGFAVSITAGALLAALCDFSRRARRAVEPLLVGSQTIPMIAIAPLLVIWFGFGMTPKVIVVTLVTFFPITVSLLQGFATTATESTNLLRSMGAGPVQRFIRLRVPTALPYFFAGLRISITYAVVGAIFGEYVGSQQGLGIYMETAMNSRRTDLVFDAVAVSALITLLLYLAVTVLERLLIPWQRRGRTEKSP